MAVNAPSTTPTTARRASRRGLAKCEANLTKEKEKHQASRKENTGTTNLSPTLRTDVKYALPLTAKAVRVGAADYTSVVSKAVMVNTPPGNTIVAKILQRAPTKQSDSLQQHPPANPHCGCCTCFVGSLARQTSSTTSRSLAWSTNFLCMLRRSMWNDRPQMIC